MGDVRIVGGNQNTPGGIVSAEVRQLTRARAVAFFQVNSAGDIVNPGSGGGSVTNITGINGVAPSVGGGITDSGTLRVVVASDETVPVSIAGTVNVSGTSSANPVGVSGDVSTIPKIGQTWPVSIAGTVNVIGTASANPVGVSGDVSTFQKGAWATAITGDVLLRANPGIVIGQLGATVGVNIIGGSVGGRFSASGDLNVREQSVLGVQVVGGVTSRVSISGDQLSVIQQGAWAASITGDVLLRANPGIVIGQLGATVGVNVIGGSIGGKFSASGDLTVREQAVLGVQIVGGSVGGQFSASGDLYTNQRGAWATAITGDVLLRANPGLVIGQLGATVGVNVIGGSLGGRFSASGDLTVREQSVLGVQIVGGSVGGQFSASGDLYVNQRGAWATSITGDVAIRQDPTNTAKGTLSTPIGVNVLNPGGRVSISGDSLNVVTQGVIGVQLVGASNGMDRVGISGDAAVRTTGGLTAISGDSRIPTTYSGRITSSGSKQIAGPYTGRTIRVTRYALQGEPDNVGTTQARWGSGASGSPLSPDWALNAREGAVESVSPIGGGCIFETAAGVALFIENSGANIRYSVTFSTGDTV